MVRCCIRISLSIGINISIITKVLILVLLLALVTSISNKSLLPLSFYFRFPFLQPVNVGSSDEEYTYATWDSLPQEPHYQGLVRGKSSDTQGDRSTKGKNFS